MPSSPKKPWKTTDDSSSYASVVKSPPRPLSSPRTYPPTHKRPPITTIDLSEVRDFEPLPSPLSEATSSPTKPESFPSLKSSHNTTKQHHDHNFPTTSVPTSSPPRLSKTLAAIGTYANKSKTLKNPHSMSNKILVGGVV